MFLSIDIGDSYPKKYRCEAKFSLKHHLKGHIASTHEGKKRFNCVNCDASFSRKSNLNGHIASVHMEKEPIIILKEEGDCEGIEILGQ